MKNAFIVLLFLLFATLSGCNGTVKESFASKADVEEFVNNIIDIEDKFLIYVAEIESEVSGGLKNEFEFRSFGEKLEMLNTEYESAKQNYINLEIPNVVSTNLYEKLELFERTSSRLNGTYFKRLTDYHDYYKWLFDDDFL